MTKPSRLIDINGYVINEPQHYHEALQWAQNMVNSMEALDIDRSDMLVICNRLAEEVRFALLMLKDRPVPQDPCRVVSASSRMCEHGTKSCIIEHPQDLGEA